MSSSSRKRAPADSASRGNRVNAESRVNAENRVNVVSRVNAENRDHRVNAENRVNVESRDHQGPGGQPSDLYQRAECLEFQAVSATNNRYSDAINVVASNPVSILYPSGEEQRPLS